MRGGLVASPVRVGDGLGGRNQPLVRTASGVVGAASGGTRGGGSGTAGVDVPRAPGLGEHTFQALADAGVSAAEFASLGEAGAFGTGKGTGHRAKL